MGREYIYHSLVVFMLVSLTIKINSSQETVEPCPASLPCKCVGNTINCYNNDLTTISDFTFHANQDTFHTLDYSLNMVTNIDIKAFVTLDISTLLLNWNNISYIHPWGFKGLERSLNYLDLSHNNLKTLPDAIALLINIVSLQVHGNPIDGSIGKLGDDNHQDDGFIDSVMYSLGKNITTFSFGHVDALRYWPYTLRHFQQLRNLKVIGLNMEFMHLRSFYGFDKTIKSLSIEEANLIRIPEEIEHLSYLEELHINRNTYSFGDELLGEHTFTGLNATLKTLSLSFENLTEIPETLKYLKHLQNLSFEGNDLEFLTEHSMEILSHTNISYLSFKHCQLKRIPSSIPLVEGLNELDLSFNRLVTIENRDLQNMANLEVLRLNDNPLKYIADGEMIGLYSLYYLNLTNTLLINVPKAIHNLISLEILDIENVPIDCTCELSWLKRWIIWYDVNVEFYGECETVDQSLQSYVHDRLLRCPDLAEQDVG